MRTGMPDPTIGAWWAACCIEDLYPIETEDDVAQIIEWTTDEDGITIAGIWPTREAGIEALGGLDEASPKTRDRLTRAV